MAMKRKQVLQEKDALNKAPEGVVQKVSREAEEKQKKKVLDGLLWATVRLRQSS